MNSVTTNPSIVLPSTLPGRPVPKGFWTAEQSLEFLRVNGFRTCRPHLANLVADGRLKKYRHTVNNRRDLYKIEEVKNLLTVVEIKQGEGVKPNPQIQSEPPNRKGKHGKR